MDWLLEVLEETGMRFKLEINFGYVRRNGGKFIDKYIRVEVMREKGKLSFNKKIDCSLDGSIDVAALTLANKIALEFNS